VLDLATVIRELLMYLILCVWLCCFFDPCCSRSSPAVDRGRKWNPLRQRLDSFDYTVRQHIVGSLLFTPLLLLLPTSVFYIFFTILSAAIALTCILIEVTISMIHNTPCIKIFIWLVRRRRCPFGASFEIASCQNDSLELACHDRVCSSSEKSYLKNDRGKNRSSIMVSILHSNFLSISESSLYFSSNCFTFTWCLCIMGSSRDVFAFSIGMGGLD
jgi:phosphatidylinositol glycan class Q protein